MVVTFQKINENAVLPTYAHGASQDAGMDLYSIIGVTIMPGQTVLVHTGLKMAMPFGVQAEVRSRSGLALKGIVVANSPGTIDPSYRGEVCVILYNQSDVVQYLHAGSKVAQMVIMPYIMADVVVGNVNSAESMRGENGFGSTDVKTN